MTHLPRIIIILNILFSYIFISSEFMKSLGNLK